MYHPGVKAAGMPEEDQIDKDSVSIKYSMAMSVWEMKCEDVDQRKS